ncbi:TPA: TraX family protein [Pseudomonas aeruginosa]|nr:conjugal transfer protein TraX [Pseudomonas aeruginosa]
MAVESAAQQVGGRNAGLDLIKWLAIGTMVIDHLRYLWPAAEWLFLIGRAAFPLFSLAIAVNVLRTRPGELFTDSNTRYLSWLVVFSVLSELPFQWLATSTTTMSIMPTLAFGLLVAWGAHHRSRDAYVIALVTLGLSAFLHEHIMYGVAGVLLPAGFVIALQAKRFWYLLPALLAVAANTRNRWMGDMTEVFAWLIAIASFSAALFGQWLVNKSIARRIWPVSWWGYWFYPGHLAAIGVIKQCL